MRSSPLAVLALLVVGCGKQAGPRPAQIPSWARVAPEQVAAASVAGVPVAFENTVGMRFVLIPAGNFIMGSAPDEPGRSDDERQHAVTLTKPYYLSISTTTNAQYRRFRPDHRSGEGFAADDQPAVGMSWAEATAFTAWLDANDHSHTYRLPTEAQWEYACRAGTTTPYWFGATITPELANYGRSRGATTPAGTFPANSWGLCDMHGNAWQWCSDSHGKYPIGAVDDPWDSGQRHAPLLRGGSWSSDPKFLRAAYRNYWMAPYHAGDYDDVGLRMSASVAP